MIVTFKNKANEDMFNGIDSKYTRKLCPIELRSVVLRKLDQLDSIIMLSEY